MKGIFIIVTALVTAYSPLTVATEPPSGGIVNALHFEVDVDGSLAPKLIKLVKNAEHLNDPGDFDSLLIEAGDGRKHLISNAAIVRWDQGSGLNSRNLRAGLPGSSIRSPYLSVVPVADVTLIVFTEWGFESSPSRFRVYSLDGDDLVEAFNRLVVVHEWNVTESSVEIVVTEADYKTESRYRFSPDDSLRFHRVE